MTSLIDFNSRWLFTILIAASFFMQSPAWASAAFCESFFGTEKKTEARLEVAPSKKSASPHEIEEFHRDIQKRIDLIKNPDPRSRALWKEYFDDWRRTAPEYIRLTRHYYLKALKNNHPHARWLESMGVIFGPQESDIHVPSLESILIKHLLRMDTLVKNGLPPKDVILPERILFKGDDWVFEGSTAEPDSSHFMSIPFGAQVPAGYNGTTHLIPFAFHLKMLERNVFGVGESIGLGTASVTNLVSFILHDLAHLSIYETIPEVMPAFKAAGKSLSKAKVDFPFNIRSWPDSPFRPDQVRFLREAGLIKKWAIDQNLSLSHFTDSPDSKVADRINELGSELRLPLHALFISAKEPLTEGQAAAIRYRLVLESGSLLPKASAQWLEQRLKAEGLLPHQLDQPWYTSAEIKSHLIVAGPQSIKRAANILLEHYPKLVKIYGGASQDIVQNEVRFRTSGPTGNTHYSSMEYLYFLLNEKVKPSNQASLEQIAKAVSDLASASIESGHVDISEWLANIGRRSAYGSPLHRWRIATGAFIKDDYWLAYLP